MEREPAGSDGHNDAGTVMEKTNHLLDAMGMLASVEGVMRMFSGRT